MTLQELRKRYADLLVEARALAEKDVLTDDEQKSLDGKYSEIDGVRVKIERLEKLGTLEEFGNSRANTPPDPTGQTTEERVKVGANRAANRPYTSLGEQLRDTMRAERAGDSEARERLARIAEEQRSISGMSETVPSDGGYLVQADVAAPMLERAYGEALLPGKCFQMPISNASNRITVPYRDETSRATGSRGGSLQLYWDGEGESATAKKPKLGKSELILKKLHGLTYITDELKADAPAMTAFYEQEFIDEFSFVFDDVIVRGNGASEPLGMLTAASKVAVTATGAVNTVIWEDVVAMGAQMWSKSFRRAEWYINQNILPQLWTMSQTVGVGGVPVYLPPGGASASPYGALLGRPVNILEQCSALSTEGDIIFADLGQYYWATKGGIVGASSVHYRFIYDEEAVKWTVRVDGQPRWHSSLTPYKDTSTSKPVSPIITLSTRS